MMAKNTGRWSRNKGARGERQVAMLLSSILGTKIERKLGASRAGGSDIELEGKDYTDGRGVARHHPGWSVEVKHHNTLRVDSWWEQTLTQAETEERRPLLIWRRDREDWNFMYMYNGQPVITDEQTWADLLTNPILV